MKIRIPAPWVVLFLVVLAFPTLAFQGIQIPEEITIDAAQKKQPAVMFPHAAHTKLTECTTCHHTQEGLTADSDMQVQGCRTCHLNPEDKSVPSMSEMSMKKNPFHAGCVNCHKEQASGPTKCNECHKK